MTDWQRLGRTNKNRGKAFERRIAKFLGWTRVPYSGSHAVYGKGDVMDGYRLDNGNWLGECKTQQPGASSNISIRDEWINNLTLQTLGSRRMPALFLRLAVSGDGRSYVALPPISLAYIYTMTPVRSGVTWQTKARGDGMGFVIQRSWMDAVPDRFIALVEVEVSEELTMKWLFMSVERFKEIVREHDLDVRG